MRDVFLFDGDCGFCTWCVSVAERITRGCSFVPFQEFSDTELVIFGTSRAECLIAVQLVERVGDTLNMRKKSGAEAIGVLLSSYGTSAGVRGLGRTLSLPGVRFMAKRVYPLIARYRGFIRVPGYGKACQIGGGVERVG